MIYVGSQATAKQIYGMQAEHADAHAINIF